MEFLFDALESGMTQHPIVVAVAMGALVLLTIRNI